ncbi:MAG: PDK repeat-containing protein, partial [Elusimicrobia bacterium]
VYLASMTVLTLTSRDDLVAPGDGAGLGVGAQTVLLDGATAFAFARPAGSTQAVLASTFSLRGSDGPRELAYFAADVLEHAEPPRMLRVALDDTPPAISYGFSREPVVRSSAAWFPDDFAVVWTATDTGSGLAFVSSSSSVTAEGRGLRVSGTAADRLGHAGEASVSVNLDKTAPRVSAGADVAIVEGSSATFSGTVADNLDPAPAFGWRFSEGSAADLAPTRFFSDQGEFMAVVVATDHAGHAASSSMTVRVANAAPRLAPLGERLIKEGQPLALSAAFTDPGLLDTHTATGEWGDGHSSTMAVTEAGGSGNAEARHAYGDDGVYQAVVTVRDADGGVSTATARVTVQNAAPALAALADQSAVEGATLSLQGASFTDPGFLDTHTATVDWGDGTVSLAVIADKAVMASHAYGDNGAYTVTVTVSDDDAGTSTGTFTATVGNVAPSLAALADQSANEGASVSLLGATFTDAGVFDSHTATVDWGDGTSEGATVSSKAVQAQHTYGDDGAYAVTVTVEDDDGGASSRTFTATIANVSPSLAALANQNAAEGSVVSLQGASFGDPGFLDGHTATVDWGDFGRPGRPNCRRGLFGQPAGGDIHGPRIPRQPHGDGELGRRHDASRRHLEQDGPGPTRVWGQRGLHRRRHGGR